MTKLFSSYKQKSEISHSLVGKWPSKNKGIRDASVGRFNECEISDFCLELENGFVMLHEILTAV